MQFARGQQGVEVPLRAENLLDIKRFRIHVYWDETVFEYAGWTLQGTRSEGAWRTDLHGDLDELRGEVTYPEGQCPPSIPAGDGEVVKILLNVRTNATLGTTTFTYRDNEMNFKDCDDQMTLPLLVMGSAEITESPPASSDPRTMGVLPDRLTLRRVVPNPVDHTAEFQFGLPAAGEVVLSIYDVAGREIVRLAQRDYTDGWHSAVWDRRDRNGSEASAGVYFVQLVGLGQVRTQRILLLR
jgi:hypothetical protein